MYNEDAYLLLSGIQHFSFCRRQWALIHIEQVWHENARTAEGHLIHERVHSTGETDFRNGVLTTRGMPIKSASLGLTGQCDAVEFVLSDEGVVLHGRDGKWKVRPVEYKHGSAKADDCDRLQAAAQAMCLEEMFCCTVSEAVIFYHETRRRETISVTDEIRKNVRNAVEEMHELFKRGYTPHVKTNKRCKQCSLADSCLPELFKDKGTKSVKTYMSEHLQEDDI